VQPGDVSGPEPNEGDGSDEDLSEVRPGDMVLLFLSPEPETDSEESEEPVSPTEKKREKKINLVPTEGRFGVRKIDDRDSGAYITAIKQLNSIFGSAADKRPTMLAEWLINGIEDPVTRWDAAFELSQSLDEMTVSDRRKSEKAVDAEEGEVEISTDDPDMERVAVARQITEIHKQRVINVFASPSPENLTKLTQAQMRRSDYTLIELVKTWGGNNVAGVLLDRLRRGLSDRYDTAMLMSSIVEVLDQDAELNDIAERYGELLPGDDDERVSSESKPSPSDVQTASRTYLEERTDVLGIFLSAAQARIAVGKEGVRNVAVKGSEDIQH
jgi:hypothetical protein